MSNLDGTGRIDGVTPRTDFPPTGSTRVEQSGVNNIPVGGGAIAAPDQVLR